MHAVTVRISDENFRKLEERAQQENSTPEEVLRAQVETWLDDSPNDFQKAARYVVNKNAELYRRLS